MKHYTTIEQSKKLLGLGLDPKTADMCWTPFDEKWDAYLGAPNPDAIKKEIPCWSLGALLEVMPKEIKTDDFWGNKRAFLNIGGDESTPCVSYKVFTKDTEYYPEGVRSFHTYKEKSWIKTLYSMVVWLLENGFIEKEPKTSRE